MDPALSDANQKLLDAINHLKAQLATIRAGRANPSLIENISVSVYGSSMKLMEVGTIGAPQPNLLTVQVWDASIVKDVVKSIQEANLGLNPSQEGQTVRLPLPPLTEERREEYIKLVNSKAEEARVEARQIRQKERERFERESEAGDYGEDESDRRMKILQELIDKTMAQIDSLAKDKEAQLLQV